MQFSNPWRITQKIIAGYATAIGIAVLGGIVGLTVGDYYQRRADQTLSLAEEQLNYVSLLKATILEIRAHPQQLITVLDDPIWFDYETSEFANNIIRFESIMEDIEQFVESHPESLAASASDYASLDQNYVETVNRYQQLIERLATDINPLNLQGEELQTARRRIIEGLTSEKSIELRLQFERLAEDSSLIEQAVQKKREAAFIAQVNASRLRLQIIIGSFTMAIAIAALLAWRTSQAIAKPLVEVTNVARKVTDESDFNLRAPVTTRDEVGILAHSLNRLIQRVGDYTHELENSQETLELRVEERTQALQDTLKNLKSTQTQLIQTEKMSSLGQMVAGIAHEINNPVNFIHGNLIHLERYANDLFELVAVLQRHTPANIPEVEDTIEDVDLDFLQTDFPEMLNSMKMGSDRIKEIILSLRNFSRLDEASMKEVDVHEGLDNTLTILGNRLKRGVKVIKGHGDLPPVFCYPAQLNQVFMNLMANALDAMEESAVKDPQITITTTKVENKHIGITIQDNGTGIPDHVKTKLFDPFFTTKPIGKGTGLGLSICYQIVEKHNGTIEVKSQLDAGTEFIIRLPIKAVISQQ